MQCLQVCLQRDGISLGGYKGIFKFSCPFLKLWQNLHSIKLTVLSVRAVARSGMEQPSPPSVSEHFPPLLQPELQPLNTDSPLPSPPAPPFCPVAMILVPQARRPSCEGVLQYFPFMTDFFHLEEHLQGSSMCNVSGFPSFLRLNHLPFSY